MAYESKNTESALRWIVSILDSLKIPFQITGGLAARAYGAERELADIDLSVPDASLHRIAPFVRDYVTFGPERFKDAAWDLFLMSLRFEGQDIDLGGVDTQRIYDRSANQWLSLPAELNVSEQKIVYGMRLPVEPKHSVIAYKRMLARECDMEDVEALTRHVGSE
jgi:hypothetical protein